MEHDRMGVGGRMFKTQSISTNRHRGALEKALTPQPRFPAENFVLKRPPEAHCFLGKTMQDGGPGIRSTSGRLPRFWERERHRTGDGRWRCCPPPPAASRWPCVRPLTYWLPTNVRIKSGSRCFWKRPKLTKIKGIIYQAWWPLKEYQVPFVHGKFTKCLLCSIDG